MVCLLFVFAALASYAILLYRKYYKGGGQSTSAGCCNLKLQDSFTVKKLKKAMEAVNLKDLLKFQSENFDNLKNFFRG